MGGYVRDYFLVQTSNFLQYLLVAGIGSLTKNSLIYNTHKT